MPWIDLAAYFFGGAFLANAIPHLVSGMMGKSFQSPFARPPGQGFSSSTVNALWGFSNLVVAYLLICRVGDFHLRNSEDAVVLGTGMLLISVGTARHFGRFNGGNTPDRH